MRVTLLCMLTVLALDSAAAGATQVPEEDMDGSGEADGDKTVLVSVEGQCVECRYVRVPTIVCLFFNCTNCEQSFFFFCTPLSGYLSGGTQTTTCLASVLVAWNGT